jgi:hemerythrin-like metal-binding protein
VDRAKNLRERIAYYRQQLGEGVSAAIAAIYLREIAKAEAELRRIARGDEGTSDAMNRRLEWNDAFAIGHTLLDAQHRDLIRLINRLCAALDTKADMTAKHPDLRALLHAAKEHFEHEIAVLKAIVAGPAPAHAKAIGTSAMGAHASAHDRALDELRAIVARIEHALADDLPHHADELITWFVVHAIKYDANLKAVFQAM